MKKLVFTFIFFTILVLPCTVFSQEYTGIAIGSENNDSFFDYNEKANKIEITASRLKNAEKTEEYYFVYKKVIGDFKFSTNINVNDSVLGKNRVGIMIRNSTDFNTVFGEIGIEDSTTSRIFKSRSNTGYGTAKKICLCNEETDFLQIERKVDTVFYRVSSNGGDLKLYGKNILELQDTVLVGMFLKSVSEEQINQVEFFNVKLEKQ